ncbi:MAG: hypothetical protein P4L57_00960 [Rhizomicrobium sp.]|nr:hypothetical protein [Rhizomicrobium sp.]
MPKKTRAMTTYSVRLNSQVVKDLELRATERRSPVAALIRSAIGDYLNNLEGEDVLAQMEQRIIATIERVERQRARQRRQAELTLLEVDYIRRSMDFRFMRRLEPNEDPVSVFRRSDKSYFDWLQKVFKKRLDLLVNAVTEPTIMLDEARDTTEEVKLAEPAPAVPTPKPAGRPAPLVNAVTEPMIIPAQSGDTKDNLQPVESEPDIPAPKQSPMVATDVAPPTLR